MVSEEDIKCIEDNIKQSKRLFEEVGVYAYFDKENMTTVEKLIKGYRGLKEDNEELKKLANNKQWISPCYVAQNYIPVSLVEEKIEEIDKMIEKINKGELQRYTVGELLLSKRVLKELLKGGN